MTAPRGQDGDSHTKAIDELIGYVNNRVIGLEQEIVEKRALIVELRQLHDLAERRRADQISHEQELKS